MLTTQTDGYPTPAAVKWRAATIQKADGSRSRMRGVFKSSKAPSDGPVGISSCDTQRSDYTIGDMTANPGYHLSAMSRKSNVLAMNMIERLLRSTPAEKSSAVRILPLRRGRESLMLPCCQTPICRAAAVRGQAVAK